MASLCPRCGDALTAYSVSFFTTEIICFACTQDERMAPNYGQAVAVESAATQQGNLNFAGIGLASDDRAMLATLLRARRAR